MSKESLLPKRVTSKEAEEAFFQGKTIQFFDEHRDTIVQARKKEDDEIGADPICRVWRDGGFSKWTDGHYHILTFRRGLYVNFRIIEEGQL